MRKKVHPADKILSTPMRRPVRRFDIERGVQYVSQQATAWPVAAPEFFGCLGTARAPEVKLEHLRKICVRFSLWLTSCTGAQPIPARARAPRLAPASRRHWAWCRRNIAMIASAAATSKTGANVSPYFVWTFRNCRTKHDKLRFKARLEPVAELLKRGQLAAGHVPWTEQVRWPVTTLRQPGRLAQFLRLRTDQQQQSNSRPSQSMYMLANTGQTMASPRRRPKTGFTFSAKN